jgi:uncharacterized protein
MMTGRNRLILGAIMAALLASTPAYADVKSGIDAYQRGDFAAAVSAWRPMAIAGDADAQYNLGQAYRLGRGVPVDPQMAESWFKKAADQGHERARNAYGLTLFQNGRRQEAIPFIEESAGRGYPQSQYVFATLLFNGDMVEKDWVRSYALMTRAAAGDVAAAKAGLAQLDKYIPVDQRQRGLRLAEVLGNANPNLAEVGNDGGSGTTITRADPPPSDVAPATKPPVVATSKPPVAKPPVYKPPVVAAVTPAPRPTPAAVGGAWRVQLGAFGNASGASALWRSLQSRIGALGPYQSFIVPAGAVTRLQAGPLPNRAAADKLCASVKAGGNACLVVAP